AVSREPRAAAQGPRATLRTQRARGGSHWAAQGTGRRTPPSACPSVLARRVAPAEPLSPPGPNQR
ncbi:hypothetical protein P7K49_002387, partial [Saguinus oedipus]